MTVPKGYDASASATAASIFITIIVLAIPLLTAPIIITSAYAQFIAPLWLCALRKCKFLQPI